jgi:hypothetical protein
MKDLAGLLNPPPFYADSISTCPLSASVSVLLCVRSLLLRNLPWSRTMSFSCVYRWMKRSLAARSRTRLTGKRRNQPGRAGRPLWLELLETREVPSATITTVAGQRTAGFGGDGGLAIHARMDQPSGVATDAKGDLYIIDDYNERVREVTPKGTILTFAGTGIVGDDGDGGPASMATFEFGDGGGVAVDSQGDVFIADPDKGDVREVTPNGIINTFAGGGDSPSGQGDGGLATQASLVEPYAVAVDARGDVFICDSGTNTIREVTPDGIIHTVAGMLSNDHPIGGPGGFSGDGGPATQALLNEPSDVAVDSKGDLFIVDSGNDRIREVTPNGIINTIAGNGTVGYKGNGGRATSAELNLDNEGCVAVDAKGNLFIADSGNNAIREVSTAGIITTVAGNPRAGYSGNGGPAASATLNNPTGVTVSTTGELYIADTYNNVVREVSGVAAAVTLQLTAVINSSSQVSVGFNAFPGATNYVLSMAQGNAAPTTVPQSKFTVESSNAQPSGNVVGNLQPGTIYLFRVVAILADGKTTTAFLQVETAAATQQASVQVSAAQLKALSTIVSPGSPPSLTTLSADANALNMYLNAFGINTPARVSAFLAEAAQETDGFRTLMQYSGTGFNRGRGFLMLTGQGNYTQVSSRLGLGNTIVNNPNLVAQPSYAAQTSAFYWKYELSNGNFATDQSIQGDGLANSLADQLTVQAFNSITSEVIRPGTPHTAWRQMYYQQALALFYFGLQPGEKLSTVNGAPASTLTTLLAALQNPNNHLGSPVTLTITAAGHAFNRVVIVGDVLPGGK